MKRNFLISCTLLAVALLGAPVAYGQNGKIRIEHLERLEQEADEAVDVTIDGNILGLAVSALSHDTSPDGKAVRDLVAGLKGIYVKSFEFDREGVYTPADVDAIRSQLGTPGWERMVNVRSKRERENVEVYMLMVADKMEGLAILAFGPRKLTIVNIVGPVDLDKLSKLDGDFGIPQLVVEPGGAIQKKY